MLSILPVPILNDNYVWLGYEGKHAFVVDPGDANPVQAMLAQLDLQLAAILVTHHHKDHIGGVAELVDHWHCPVYGPASISLVDHPVADGDRLQLTAPLAHFDVMAVPGHTLDHLAYYGDGALFCGDTLFASGCGRLFEGTALQMQQSLARLAALPAATRVYCTHEYTLSNQRFALAVEPQNTALIQRAEIDTRTRQLQQPTVPSTIGQELATNPFLRWNQTDVIIAAMQHGAADESPAEIFGAIRRWKDNFA